MEAAQEVASDSSEHHDVIAEVIPRMPAADLQEQTWLNEQLMETGPEGLRVLLAYLTPPGLGDDTYARYAVSGLTKHVSRPGAESGRQMYEGALLDALSAGPSAHVAVFLLHQLEVIGSERAIPVVEAFLTDEGLYEPAAEVLVGIETPSAVQALQAALVMAEDASRQETFIKALGDVQNASVAGDLLPYASSGEWHVRRAALYALARSGNPVATAALAEAADTTRAARQVTARSYYLLHAERLAEEGHAAESAEIARRVLGVNSPNHITHAALSVLVQAEGAEALETVLDVSESADRELRLGALELTRKLPGEAVTDAVLTRLSGADAPVRADMIAMLGRRGDTSALAALTPYLEDADSRVRVSTVEALAALAEEEVLPELLAALNRAEDTGEIAAVETALLRMPTDRLLPAAAEVLPIVSDSAKPVLIRIIAERRGREHLAAILDERASSDQAVRLEVYRALGVLATPVQLSALVGYLSEAEHDEEREALQEALAAIWEGMDVVEDREEAISTMWAEASGSQRDSFIEVLPRLGGDEALKVTVEAAGSTEPATREIATKALTHWSESRAMPALLEVVGHTESSELRILLLERYVHLVEASDASHDEKREHLREAVAAARTPEERALVVGSLSLVERSVALRAASEHWTDSEAVVRESAHEVTAEILASAFDAESTSSGGLDVLLAAVEAANSPELAQRLEARLAEVRADAGSGSSEPGDVFEMASPPIELFDGESLDGWEPVGESSGGWDVEDGVLYTDGSGGGGWLSTTRTYDDFRLELEYRVPEGGNSGVFLRAPREGNPAYQGMEIQILDDYAEQYANLHAWQYTGSIYDVKAPSKRVSKPAGEWQKMEIVANGPIIQVVLNGEMIVNTSLVDHMHLVDGHPGLTRRSGYIGLQNHSTRIEYRNIVIQEL